MPTSLRLLESQSPHRSLQATPRATSELAGAVHHGLPATLDRIRVPAAPYLDPTRLQRAAQVGWLIGTAAVDLTFGTHWAITKRLQSNTYSRHVKQDNQRVAWLLARDPLLARASNPTRLDVQQNAHTMLALNRHGHRAAQVRKHFYGDAVVVGGLPFGAGLTIGPQIGGGFTAALTAASVPLLWIGGPILAAAAVGVAVHEGVRYRRAVRLKRNIHLIGRNPVMGNEVAVQALLAARIRSKKIHASTKSASVIGCGVSAPLLAVGLAPGLAVLCPAATVLIWAWYYHHNNLRYRPSLTPAERIMLGSEQDIINRVDLAHRTRSVLKSLKERKRLIYPRGGQGIPGLRESAQSLAWIRRKWSGVPKHYAGTPETVFGFLRSLADLEIDFVRRQEVLHHRRLAALYCENVDEEEGGKRQAELAGQRAALSAWLRDRTSEARVLSAYEGTPDAGTVARHFLTFLQRYRLLDDFTRDAILRNAPVKHHFLKLGAVAQSKKSFHFEVGRVAQLMDTSAGPASSSSKRLARELCDIAERYLLRDEKKRQTFLERELLDVLAYRLDGPTHHDYPGRARAS